jgi:hypothetical protein
MAMANDQINFLSAIPFVIDNDGDVWIAVIVKQ